jgi:outer membrane lipoprotein-sorting protein
MKKLIISILMLLLTVSAQAQIPQEVIDVLTKCSQKMDNPAGIQCDMKASAGISFVKVNVNLTLYSKGEKSFEKTSMKILGKEIKAESGFDGVQEWEYQPKIKKDDKDTLTITKRVKKSKGEYDIDFDLHKDYKTAKMQVKNGFYVITFTNPKDKEAPKKTVMKINKDNYVFQELSASDSGVTMKVTLIKMKIGVPDSVFKFDPKRYPNAVIVRK